MLRTVSLSINWLQVLGTTELAQIGSVSKVEMMTPIPLICKVLFPSISTFETPPYIAHPLRDLLAQRIYQIASGYADGNDANSLRRDPLLKLGVERPPLAPEQDLASAPTFSRLEHSVDRKDLYRLTQALGAHFVASYPEPPAAIVLDLDHTDDPTHGQQELTFYNHYYKNYYYLPLLVFEGLSGALVTACLRPGTRPTGAENAMILVRLLALLRRHWPQTHILVRGDSHFATP
jgi:hypothetical protein